MCHPEMVVIIKNGIVTDTKSSEKTVIVILEKDYRRDTDIVRVGKIRNKSSQLSKYYIN